MGVQLKSPAELQRMRAAGLVVADVLARLAAAAAPGVSTADLDALAREELAAAGATSSFLGYHGFPGVICASVNEQVVHGIPSPRQVLRDGDLLSVDFGAVVDGWHGDAAVTVPVGQVAPELTALTAVAEDALWAGIAAARPGGRLSDIGYAVETTVRPHGYGLLEDYTGHGIGTAMHMDPYVPNLAPRGPGKGLKLKAGLAVAIEPMLTLGSPEVVTLEDDWTVVTGDGRGSAHVEHTVAVTEDGPWVLTAHDGGLSRLGAAGAAGRWAAGQGSPLEPVRTA